MTTDTIRPWLGSRHQRPDGSEAHITTQFATLGDNAADQLALDLRSVLGGANSIVVTHDNRTIEFAEPVLKALKDQGFNPQTYCFEDEADGSSPANEEANSQKLAKFLEEKQSVAAVAVGSGTINDLTKYGCALLSLPYMVFGTAASMNGYNSPIAALYVKGLKSSVPATPALGMYADPTVIAQAPLTMHLAGLGDLCSKPFAGADAAIASILAGEQPWRAPMEMVHESFERVLSYAEGIKNSDPEAIQVLMEGLWISGFSMALAGTSAPASGGEHLWSHRIDMMRHDAALPPMALHGTQVGIACGLVRPLFSQAAELSQAEVRQRLDGPLQEPSESEFEQLESWLESRHSDLSQKSRAAMLKPAQLKFDCATRRKIREQLANNWPAIREELLVAHQHAERVEVALQTANAPRDPVEMNLSHEESKRILTVCRDIRNRFTILDLTAEVLGESALVARFSF